METKCKHQPIRIGEQLVHKSRNRPWIIDRSVAIVRKFVCIHTGLDWIGPRHVHHGRPRKYWPGCWRVCSTSHQGWWRLAGCMLLLKS